MLNRFSIVIFALSLTACNSDKPIGVLSAGKMEDVLVDYHMAQAMADEMPGDNTENRFLLVQAALKKNNVTQAELDSSLVYWCENSEKFKDIYMKVYQRLSDKATLIGVEQQKTTIQYSEMKTEGDTANIWTLKKFAILLPTTQDNMYTFTMDADTSFHAGDGFLWAFNAQFLSMNAPSNAYALLRIEYTNDSIVGQQQFIANGPCEVSLPCQIIHKQTPIRRVTGTIYMPINDEGFCVTAIKDFALVRYHNVEKNIAPVDSTIIKNQMGYKNQNPTSRPKADSIRVHQNPHKLRDDDAHKHTINIVRDQPIVQHKRR